MGATWRHGPHHTAQKSTSTGFWLLRTDASNEVSVSSRTFPDILEFLSFLRRTARLRASRDGRVAGVRASSDRRGRPRWGQHFLSNAKTIERILDALGAREGETVVEIGPGKGALTRPLLERVRRL